MVILYGASLKKLHGKYGGFRIYIPKKMPNYKENLINDFNGYNYVDLAIKYGISEEHTRKLIREHKEVS